MSRTRKPNRKYPENHYTASEKLICLITLLSDHRWHTTDWLAHQFGTTERTILRDLDKIENATKVTVERRPGKGVRLEPKYHLKGIGAGPDESINLILAVAYSPKIGFSLVQVAKTLDKLREALPPGLATQVDWFRTRFHFDIPAHTNGLRFLDLIRKAIFESRRIKVRHLGISDGVSDAHEINPFGLVYYHDKWYLIGFDYKNAERRVFRIDRFLECAMQKIRFTPPDDFDAQDHWYKVFWKQYGRNAETIILVFDSEYADRVQAWDSIERKSLADGALQATFKAMNPEWVKGFVLSCGKHCRVTEPAWLRDVVKQEAADIVANYAGTPRKE